MCSIYKTGLSTCGIVLVGLDVRNPPSCGILRRAELPGGEDIATGYLEMPISLFGPLLSTEMRPVTPPPGALCPVPRALLSSIRSKPRSKPT